MNAKQCPLQTERYMYCIMIITTSIYLAYLVFEGYVLLKFVTKWWLNCFNSEHSPGEPAPLPLHLPPEKKFVDLTLYCL